jgi:hypothetical protein
MTFNDEVVALNACEEAVVWNDNKTLTEFWESCTRPEWFVWVLEQTNIDRDTVIAIAVEIAERVAHLNAEPHLDEYLPTLKNWVEETKKGKPKGRGIVRKHPREQTGNYGGAALRHALDITRSNRTDKEAAGILAAVAADAANAVGVAAHFSGTGTLDDARATEQQFQVGIIRKHINTAKIVELWNTRNL